jgi:short-subunit dehydrogenase
MRALVTGASSGIGAAMAKELALIHRSFINC